MGDFEQRSLFVSHQKRDIFFILMSRYYLQVYLKFLKYTGTFFWVRFLKNPLDIRLFLFGTFLETII